MISAESSQVVKHTSMPSIMPYPSRSLCTASSLLVEFYFKETAQMYSCYDSQMNPFRSTVSRLWNSSPVIHSTLQSMAASCLVDSFPQMAQLGRRLREDAVSMLSEDSMDDQSLLALMMLGGTANWTDSKDLGIPLFNAFKSKLSSVSQSPFATNNLQFFQDSLVYWEMLLCYVSDNIDVSHVPLSDTTKQYFPSKHVPHPWTGIARETQLILQEVGRLVRRQRLHAHSRAFASKAQIKRLQQAMSAAEELEGQLMSIVVPAEADIISPEDRDTPVWHLLNLAEVYRRTGLVQLYHVFPDLLARRLGSGRAAHVAGGLIALSSTARVMEGRVGSHVQWLTQFAVDTLALLKTIPVESGTRDFQPFLLVALSSELRLPLHSAYDVESVDLFPTLDDGPSTLSPNLGNRDIFPSGHDLELSARAIEVARMREFVHSRLMSFLHGLPPSPIRVCLQLVKETWAQMDTTTAVTLERQERLRRRQMETSVEEVKDDSDEEAWSDVYWMDVMIEHGWEFVV